MKLAALAFSGLTGLSLLASPAWGQTTPGFDFEVDAGLDDGANDIWEASPGTEGANLEFALDAAVTWGSITTGTQLTHAYDFPGGSTGSGEGGIGGGKLSRISDGPGECYSFQDGPTPPGWDVQDVTIEIWFRPDNLTPPDGGYTLWEDGGGTGFGLFITNNEVITSQDTDQARIAYNLDTDTSNLLLDDDPTMEFTQVVVTRTAAGATIMYVNGQQVGTGDDGDGDWSGGDGFALGARGEANTGGRGSGDGTGSDGTTRSFDGQIALFRVYNDQVLTPAEVLANFDELSGPDLTAPVIDTVSPEGPGIFPGTNLVITFDEDVQAGTATAGTEFINIRDLTNPGSPVVTSIDITDATQVSFSGNQVTIDPTGNLAFDTPYAVQITSGAIADQADTPNLFAGIADDATWTFTTAAQDLIAPVVQSLAPQDPTEATITDNLVLTFDDPVVAGTGNINIRDITDPLNPVVTTISATDASQVSISGNVVTINPAAALTGGANFAIQIDSGAFENFSGVAYPGISDDSTWTFATLEALLIYEPFNDLDPTLDGNTPGLGLTGTWSGQSLVADSSLIYGGLAYEGGRALTNPGNNYDQCSISPGTTLTDAGLMDDGATLWFSALIVKAPKVSDSNDRRIYVAYGTGPADGFDRVGDPNGGFTVAVNKVNNDGVTAQAWNDGHATVGATRGVTDLSVADGDTFLAVGKITWGEFGVTDDVFELYLPDEDLTLGTPVSTITADFDQLGTTDANYAFDTISFAGGVALNAVPEVDEIRFGAAYAAVAPIDVSAPVLVSTDPVDDSLDGNATQQVATFNEPVFVGAGDIRIVNDTDTVTTTIPVGDPRIVVAGNTLTITPTTPLLGGKAYHIEIDAGAVTNFNGLDFGGISSATEWNFTVDGTAPTVASIEDNVSPLPLLVNTGLTYTVTFNEPIDAGTVDTTDFANGGSATITVDGVSPTADPAVFEVAVSATSTGELTLEIVASALITDISGNPLDTSSAIPDDTTIAVNDPTPTAASLVADFQATIGSEQNANGTGEARYFHVSVNPDNPGTGWYCADLPNSGDDGPPGVRNYGGDVVAYKFLGGTNNSITGVTGSGGEPDRITYATEDTSFDGFGQQQLRLWTTNDPGADLATGAGLGATGFASIGNFGYRSFGGAVGTIDISGLESGSLHIYYGAFSATPTVRVTMRDTDNVAADITLADVHLNGDAANRTEYYLAEVDFVTDGFYDVIEYEWLANGVDYSGNGRGLGTVLTGPEPVDDYSTWAELYPGADLTDPDADFDGDGLSNDTERLFGLDPTDPASVNPISVGLEPAAGTFSFTRRDDALTGRFTGIETSFDLQMWTRDDGAQLVVTGPDANGVETVEVTLSPGLLTGSKLFVRVVQDDGTLFSENFEMGDGGFSVVTAAGSDWQYGTPDSIGFAGQTVTTGNGGSANCWGTNLGSFTTNGATFEGYYASPTDTCLRSAVIDLTGVDAAELSFAQAIDVEGADSVTVNILDATGNPVAEDIVAISDDDPNSADWQTVGPIALPAAAITEGQIVIEWCLTGTGEPSFDYMGWYIDDVSVKRVAAP